MRSLLLLLLALCSSAAWADVLKGRVVRVADGDKITLLEQWVQHSKWRWRSSPTQRATRLAEQLSTGFFTTSGLVALHSNVMRRASALLLTFLLLVAGGCSVAPKRELPPAPTEEAPASA